MKDIGRDRGKDRVKDRVTDRGRDNWIMCRQLAAIISLCTI